MYNNIVNPLTNDIADIFSKEGKHILQNYVNTYISNIKTQYGGRMCWDTTSCDWVICAGSTPDSKLRTSCEKVILDYFEIKHDGELYDGDYPPFWSQPRISRGGFGIIDKNTRMFQKKDLNSIIEQHIKVNGLPSEEVIYNFINLINLRLADSENKHKATTMGKTVAHNNILLGILQAFWKLTSMIKDKKVMVEIRHMLPCIEEHIAELDWVEVKDELKSLYLNVQVHTEHVDISEQVDGFLDKHWPDGPYVAGGDSKEAT